jgi:two-component system sensor histidine kinase PilS (NtrC family)
MFGRTRRALLSSAATDTRWAGDSSKPDGIRARLSRVLRSQARGAATDTARRLLMLTGAFRVFVALALLSVALLFREPPLLGARHLDLFVFTAIGYAVLGVALLVRQRSNFTTSLAPVEVLVDILAVSTLSYSSGGIASGIAGLLVVFVAAASLALTTRYALFAASLAALAVLVGQIAFFIQGAGAINEFISAGMLGGIILMTAAIGNPLAQRLEESEALARQRGIDLANLAQLNDYIIQNLRESIVVVDAADDIRLMNQPAAEVLGAQSREPGQKLSRISPELSRLLQEWRQDHDRIAQVPMLTSADGTSQIISNIAPLDGRTDGPVLMFLEDAGLIAEKVQQSKLAALGRLTASIAHEIRNPVGAMSHAGQLLEESAGLADDDKRLLQIIRTNSRRVSDIVDSILNLSRRDASKPQLLGLAGWSATFVAEFTSTMELFEGQVATLPGEDVEVRMDPRHLQQIVWNLCENAVKYASEAAGGIAVEISWGRMAGNRRPFLAVTDSGPGIADSLRDRVFEPFATGPTGGTGLGLFISRELCELNRAALVHESRKGGGSIFRIVFADPSRWSSV